MLVIVPDAGAFRRVEERLSVSLLSRIDAESEAMTVALSMPRFETSTSLDLKEIIRDGLGYQNIFDTMQLPGIGVKTAVTEAFHQVKVIVDEQGTEAATATYIGVIALSAPPAADLSVRVDRPFLYVIRDTSTGVILFVGKVLNPAS